MIDAAWQARAVWAILLAAPVTAAVLVFISAPYGRQARGGWGPVLPGRLGWLAMEWPTLVVFGAVFLEGSHRHDPVPMLLAAMWLGHYVHRTLIFPWRLRSTKPIPVVVALLAMSFQALNSYANAAWIAEDVAKVPIAPGTAHLGAGHPVGGIRECAHRIGLDLLEEAGPPATAVELVLGIVELSAAARAVVGTGSGLVEVASRAGSLRGRLAENRELHGRQDGLPVRGVQGVR